MREPFWKIRGKNVFWLPRQRQQERRGNIIRVYWLKQSKEKGTLTNHSEFCRGRTRQRAPSVKRRRIFLLCVCFNKFDFGAIFWETLRDSPFFKWKSSRPFNLLVPVMPVQNVYSKLFWWSQRKLSHVNMKAEHQCRSSPEMTPPLPSPQKNGKKNPQNTTGSMLEGTNSGKCNFVRWVFSAAFSERRFRSE